MRILKAIHTWPPEGRGGTEAHAAVVARGLCGRGHQVGVFARTGRPDRPEYEVTTGWDGAVGITRVNNTFRDAPTFRWIYANQHIHESFERELAEFKPDLVHIHHLTGLSTTIIEAVKSRGLPIVMTLHDFWTVCPRGQRMTRDLDLCEDVDRNKCYECLAGLWPHIFAAREAEPTVVDNRSHLSPRVMAEWDQHMSYVLGLCDVLIAPSAFHRERMLDFQISPERIIALPHGLDHGPFDGRQREPREVQRIGYIGSVIPVKGVHLLIEAFLALDRRDIELHIYGDMPSFHDDSTYHQRLEDAARGMKNVIFHGAYEANDVPGILEDLDILVITSLWWETFCLTIREGLLAGVPVLAPDHGAMREALDGERDGLFFRAGNAEDLRDKLELLINDDHLRERLMNRGEAVKSMTVYLEELEEIYAEAARLSVRRAPSLVVAPPSFPRADDLPAGLAGLDLQSIPWDRIGVSVQQAGTASVSLSTRMPSSDTPSLGIDLSFKDVDRDLGNVELTVDLAALGDARLADVTAIAGVSPESPPSDESSALDASSVALDASSVALSENTPRPKAPPPLKPEPDASRGTVGLPAEEAIRHPRSKGSRSGSAPKTRSSRPRPRTGVEAAPVSGERGQRQRAPRPGPTEKKKVDGASSRVVREDVARGPIRTERWSMRRAPAKLRKVLPS